ncbi:MAG TPA: NIPSNAP family protein [bacterium]|nr:NIPSNAP family protein [bacterium]
MDQEHTTAAKDSGRGESAAYLEWRHYIAPYGDRRKRLLDFFQHVAVPAWNRQGISPVGLFGALYGSSSSSIYVLLPHADSDSVLYSEDRLLQDSEYMRDGAFFHSLSGSDPGYWRIENSLLRCFAPLSMSAVRIQGTARVFEWRIYANPNQLQTRQKIHMFTQAGEIELFRRCGLTPVFFAETLIGPQRPNLQYLLVFKDMAERDNRWSAFRRHPDWAVLKNRPEYADAVCNVTDLMLQPLDFSQV